MTRKDYKLIAEVISNLNFTLEHKLFIVQRFADKLTEDNIAFNRFKFIDTCMVEK